MSNMTFSEPIHRKGQDESPLAQRVSFTDDETGVVTTAATAEAITFSDDEAGSVGPLNYELAQQTFGHYADSTAYQSPVAPHRARLLADVESEHAQASMADEDDSAAAPATDQRANPTAKAQAGQFREAMKGKIEAVQTTVSEAAELFQSAIIAEKLAPKAHKPADRLIDLIIGVVFTQIGNFAKDLVGGGPIGAVVKQAVSLIKSAAKADHPPGGEKEVIDQIVSCANQAAGQFVVNATQLLDTLPVDQSAGDLQLLQATKNAPSVQAAKVGDSPLQGNIEHGIENEFLEATGAPSTGGAAAEAMATEMLRTYKAARIEFFDGPSGQSAAIREVLSDSAPGEIARAETADGLADSIYADKAERARASAVSNGDDN
jgi:hypothetical protein